MFKYTKHTLKKIEALFGEIEYTIRYERGNFQSGYCIVENRRIAVINKFYDTEARINCLLEILSTQEIEEESLSEKGVEWYKKLSKQILANEAATEEAGEQEVQKEEDATQSEKEPQL
ncbi:MAG: hypothetical protein AAF985_08340 [Bacteroidota bacterium]